MGSLIEFLASIMVSVIGIFHRVTQTYWIDIILLTATVRLLLSPVNRMQTRSMKVMTEMQPEIKVVQEKYKVGPDDSPEVKQQKAQDMQKETWALYKTHGTSPVASCLPMLIQMPILISFFWVLRSPKYYDLLPGFRQASIFGANLTLKAFETSPFPNIESLPGMIDLGSLINTPFLLDKFLYLPALPLFIIYLATTYLQTSQMKASNPQSQQGPMNYMFIMFLWFGLIFPVGLLLYFALSNLFQMQQYASMRKADAIVKKETETEIKTIEDKPPPSPPPPKKRKKKRKK